MSHSAGCPVGTVVSSFMRFSPWFFGLIMIVGGPFVALFGKRYFSWIIAGIVIVSFHLAVLGFCSIAGFMETNGGVAISIGVALLVAILSGFFVYRVVRIGEIVLGFVGGFITGSLFYTIVLAVNQTGSVWSMLIICMFFAVAGCWLAYKIRSILLVFTSLLGSYSFVRGFSYFLGGYPSEITIMSRLN